jgi:hypothetical protein
MMMRGASVGPMTRGGMMATAPFASGRVQGFGGRTFSRNNFAFHDRFRNFAFHDRFHHRFHRRNFFAFGFFGGPFYDYASSCWSWLPTRLGWRWVYVCGDYGFY